MLKSKVFIFILFLLVSIIIGFYNQNRREKLLKFNTKETHAIYDGFAIVKNTGPESYFYFKVNDQKILTFELGKYEFLQKGDTVLIKYSLEDPSVAEVIDFCYMRKHKGKAYCK